MTRMSEADRRFGSSALSIFVAFVFSWPSRFLEHITHRFPCITHTYGVKMCRPHLHSLYTDATGNIWKYAAYGWEYNSNLVRASDSKLLDGFKARLWAPS